MSVLHSPRAPWLMLALFCIAALSFFMAAAGHDLGLLPEAASTREKGAVVNEIRRAITRSEQKMVDLEKDMAHKTGETLEHAGQKLMEWAGMHKAETAPAPPPAPQPAPVRPVPEKPATDIPGRVLSHAFSLTGQGFEAVFATDRQIPQPRIFFIADPARWVVDVPGIWTNTARYNNTVADGFIARVVLGEHEDYLRIVFHFRDTTRMQPEHPPQIARQENGFAVLVPASEF